MENKSVGQEASNVLENKIIINDEQDNKSIVSMAGVIIQKPSHQSSEVMSKKNSFIQSKNRERKCFWKYRIEGHLK